MSKPLYASDVGLPRQLAASAGGAAVKRPQQGWDGNRRVRLGPVDGRGQLAEARELQVTPDDARGRADERRVLVDRDELLVPDRLDVPGIKGILIKSIAALKSGASISTVWRVSSPGPRSASQCEQDRESENESDIQSPKGGKAKVCRNVGVTAGPCRWFKSITGLGKSTTTAIITSS